MKRRMLYMLIAVVVAMTMVSCGDSEESLSARSAKKAVEKELKRLNGSVQYTSLRTGFFECNSESVRYRYRKLAANGLVTYSCSKVRKAERVRKSRQVQRGYYFTYYDTEYYYVTDSVDAYFVDVALTEQGMKYLKEEDEKTVVLLDPALDNSKIIERFEATVFPEDSVEVVEFPLPQADTIANIKADTIVNAKAQPTTVSTVNAKDPYQEMKNREHEETILVKSCDIKIVKVFNILLTHGDAPHATGKIVYSTVNVSPFGRVIEHVMEGERDDMNVSFIYTQDKGWIARGVADE